MIRHKCQFRIPSDEVESNTPEHEPTDEPLRFDPDSHHNDNDSEAARLDGEARIETEKVLLETGKTALASSAVFMSAVVGHVPFRTLAQLIKLVFKLEDTVDDGAVIELVIAKNAAHTPLRSFHFHHLGSHLLNSDSLHQCLLRTSRSEMRNFHSPYSDVVNALPSFSVFDEVTGEAKSVFKRRHLDLNESMHPFLPSVEYERDSASKKDDLTSDSDADKSFGATTNVPIGHVSVVSTKAMFDRALNVFTLGLLKNVPLARDKAIVAGGAICACLHPWPAHILKKYRLEARMETFLYGSVLAAFPKEIAVMIERYAGFIAKWADAVDVELFHHLCGQASPYSGSDIDVFFVCPQGATNVTAAVNHLPAMHQAILKNRAAAPVRKYIDLNQPHWIRHIDGMDPEYDWFIDADNEVEKVNAEKQGREFKPFSERYENLPASDKKPDKRGWTLVHERAVEARLRLLWTVRTTNSVTIAGCHPVRHTQLMLPVVRAAEQVVYPFDLDCVSVFYDGNKVYATPRALRSFNTRTNFVDTPPLLYGPSVEPSDLLQQIQTFESPENFTKLRNRSPLVHILRHATTSNTLSFQSEIQKSRDDLIPMQFKFLKDAVIGRRVKFGTAFHLCYMCKTDVAFEDAGEEEVCVDSDSMEEDGSEASVAEENDGSEASVAEKSDGNEKTNPPRKIALCADCHALNARKQAETADMTGMHALVTGGRIKIGKAVALRLLRNGATVHVTTRFPLLLIHAFRTEEDSEVWWSRLNVYSLDLKNLAAVAAFCEYLMGRLERIDVFVQNAAQTVWRPPQYYEPMVKGESELLGSMGDSELLRWVRFDVAGSRSIPLGTFENLSLEAASPGLDGNASAAPMDSITVASEAVVSPWSLEQAAQSADPIDLRSVTTWNQTLPQIPTTEMAEVLIINSFAPMMLLQKLQPLLSPASRPRANPSFVVNVTSREGSFAATRDQDGRASFFNDVAGLHPHTNMAKAALNRLTQTIAPDWAIQGVYVTAVDPGWVSLMGPDGEGRSAVEPPLTAEDGAARILDPVFTGLKGKAFWSGVLLRNFRVSDW
ncbi:hypothetical protein CcCBS67573_g08183 [Chytriomyces confervae]|uniref:Uncharacterized protein n=1 Tax=Chytriomyces confervae TaxID=246404 RepID=A0A507EPZ2_9FUNG|nr:hypothetical protein CcCBS67573_g08183 [Chytriomyces confervae]